MEEQQIGLVSVVIPTYGRAQYLRRAVDSVLRQTYENIEVIVVDDNGDGTKGRIQTEKIMRYYAGNPRVSYITYEKNRNGSHARNTGIQKSKGEFIAFLDDDDEMLKDKIRLQVKAFCGLDGSWGACYTGYSVLKGNGYREVSCEKRMGKPYFEALARSFYICGGSNLLIRRKVIETVGCFDETFRRNQDIEFVVRILEQYKIAYVDSMQLLVHTENQAERKKIYSHETESAIDDFYLAKFRNKIEGLDKKKKRRLYQYFALERFKREAGTKYMFGSAIHLLRRRVSPFLFCRYAFYLADRKKNHTIYGFRLM